MNQEKLNRAMRTRIMLYSYGFGDAADILYDVPKLLDRIEKLEAVNISLNRELLAHKDALAQAV